MKRLLTPAPIIAILYHEGPDVDPVMRRIASQLSANGLSLAGFIQRDEWRADRPRCDMILEDLAGGRSIQISYDRGSGARGCRLDANELLSAMLTAREAIAARPDLLIVNKFGKAESEGGGFRDLITEAVAEDVPVLVAVPWRNIDNWRRFVGEFAVECRVEELPSDDADLCRLLGLQRQEAVNECAVAMPGEATTTRARIFESTRLKRKSQRYAALISVVWIGAWSFSSSPQLAQRIMASHVAAVFGRLLHGYFLRASRRRMGAAQVEMTARWRIQR